MALIFHFSFLTIIFIVFLANEEKFIQENLQKLSKNVESVTLEPQPTSSLPFPAQHNDHF